MGESVDVSHTYISILIYFESFRIIQYVFQEEQVNGV